MNDLFKLEKPLSEEVVKSHWVYTDKVYISCVCTTFQQCGYIRDTINGFLGQETKYRFEIIIHDDCSNDGTKKIIEEYKNAYPTLIKLVIQTENQYSKGKRIWPIALSYAEGVFIALCEGDDFWIDKYKIQYEAEVLINRGEVSLIHTKCYDYNVSNRTCEVSHVPKVMNNIESLLLSNNIHTLTTMFRRSYFIKFTEVFSENINTWGFGDLPLWIYLSTLGEIVLLDRNTAVYRVLTESASHSRSEEKMQLFAKHGMDIRVHMAKKYYNKLQKSKALNELANRHIYTAIMYDYKVESFLIKHARFDNRILILLFQFRYTKLLSKRLLKFKLKIYNFLKRYFLLFKAS
ncbi:glycosyltransferase [Pseudoalteromonas sp. NZS11_1]|uniref:glycosyltransferase n=1 Tax=Pseudoalteromonas sp. NZS11_1 TaxID=2792070 RepID=UPI0018CD45FE|nr:glycosyltransferase [Pseudoalteromonas sp. NZS11_1]MBH0044849.1 glycosyltransferase [Pseudoalteromonas sp. NZS11_1]